MPEDQSQTPTSAAQPTPVLSRRQRHPLQPPHKASGFTLMETLVVIGIVGILLSVAIPSFQSFHEARRLEGIASVLATDLHYLRGEAIARNQKLHIRFGSDNSGTCYVLHTGNLGDCTCDSSGGTQCSNTSQSLKNIGMAGHLGVRVESNVSSILFEPTRGTATPAGSITISANGGQAIRHIVNIVGRTRTCSPDKSMGGYPNC